MVVLIRHSMILLLFALLSNPVLECSGAKILGLVPTFGKSHWMSIAPLFKELAVRGHEVTVLGMFAPDKPIPNYTHIDVNIDANDIFDSIGQDRNTFSIGDIPVPLMMMFMPKMGKAMAELSLNHPNTQELIHDKEKHFDVIIYEQFFNEAVLGFIHKYKAPAISFTTFVGDEFVFEAVGNPYPYSYASSAFLSYSDHMTFCQRLYNTVIEIWFKAVLYLTHYPTQNEIMQKHFGHIEGLPHVLDIYRNTSLMLLNSHESFSYPKPLLPNVIPIGGLHITKPKKLPEDLQKFMDDASEGVVYFSMGSNLRSADFSAETRNAFLTVFSKLKQKVLWKFEDENLPGQSKNVKISSWLPQNDLLSHPNTKLFITHGGVHGTLEAIYHGVPVVGIPVLGDQKLNMARTVANGCGVTIDRSNITETSLMWALNEVLYNSRYRENAKLRSKLFKDRPHTPMDTAIFWTEYVIRHKGARYLRSAALDLTWYQYYLLDVIAVLGFFVLSVCAISVVLIKIIVRVCRTKKVTKAKKRN